MDRSRGCVCVPNRPILDEGCWRGEGGHARYKLIFPNRDGVVDQAGREKEQLKCAVYPGR